MLEHYLGQICDLMLMDGNPYGMSIVNADGVIESIHMNSLAYLPQSTVVGKHMRDVYPELDENKSTISEVLRTGKPIYNRKQELTNIHGQKIIIEATTLPIIVAGNVEGVIDFSKFYSIGSRILRWNEQNDEFRRPLERIVTINPEMQKIKEKIQMASNLDSPVLIYGETGTGKELIAEAFHGVGKRAAYPFVSQNCAAIPQNLMESIFFGTEKGSYTGATEKKGLFELANGGTLFLDEINSMDFSLQSKLLRVLEEKKVRRVGGDKDIEVDVRILTALNEDPLEAVAEKRLRLDLYYRLNVIAIKIPPLRERKEDIPLLMEFFIDKYNKEMKKSIRGISILAKEVLLQYSWPGNVRELRNLIEKAFVEAKDDVLMVENIHDYLLHASFNGKENPHRAWQNPIAFTENFSLETAVNNYEKALILKAVNETKSLSEAARKLGISRQTLQYKIQKYEVSKQIE